MILPFTQFFIIIIAVSGKNDILTSKKKAVLDKQHGGMKVFIHKEASYSSFLKKAKAELFPDADDGEYYIADINGVPIATDDLLRLQKSNEEQRVVPWTVQGYLKASGVRYQSKARFYCVQKAEGNYSIIKLLFISYVHCII